MPPCCETRRFFYYLCNWFLPLRWNKKYTVALGNAAVFPFCPEWPFLSRFPVLLVPGGITYRF